jgi:hypothetical protein
MRDFVSVLLTAYYLSSQTEDSEMGGACIIYVWDYNIKMVLNKIGCEGVNCIYTVQDRGKWLAVNTFSPAPFSKF